MQKKHPSLSDQLRQAILDSGTTRYKISMATGIGQDILSRFVHGTAGMSMDSMDAVADYLQVKIVSAIGKPKRRKTKGG